MAASGETVLITGASSGIGRELALLFAGEGARLVLVSRHAPALDELAGELRQRGAGDVLVAAADLSEPGAAAGVCARIAAAGWQIDVLVNNAGVGAHGEFHSLPRERQLAMLQLNVAALVDLTHRLLPAMIDRRRGAILNVGSTAAFQPGPLAAMYFATKAFVVSFSEALWYELRPHGIAVTCLCPGPTRTNFGSDYQLTESAGFRWNGMEARDVAQAGYCALRRGRRVVIPGLVNRLLAGVTRLAPRRLVLRATAAFNRH